jgi:hypothetical protein
LNDGRNLGISLENINFFDIKPFLAHFFNQFYGFDNRRISGFALINFAQDPKSANAYAVTTPKPETTVNNPVSRL